MITASTEHYLYLGGGTKSYGRTSNVVKPSLEVAPPPSAWKQFLRLSELHTSDC
jgi:hypothetical protein